MALTETALLALALSLAQNPTETDISAFNALHQSDQEKIELLVSEQDLLPQATENLLTQSPLFANGRVDAPTAETSVGF